MELYLSRMLCARERPENHLEKVYRDKTRGTSVDCQYLKDEESPGRQFTKIRYSETREKPGLGNIKTPKRFQERTDKESQIL